MKLKFITLLLIISVFSKMSYGQQSLVKTVNNSKIEQSDSVHLAEFKLGKEMMHKILYDSLVYPVLTVKDGFGGKVTVKFAIDTFGNIGDIKIATGVRDDINSEAIRVIGLLHEWTPTTVHGKVKTYFSLPINFIRDRRSMRRYKKAGKN